jgi:hypothetical protein
VHNLIAGSFTYVNAGTDNGAKKFPSQRYTPYHVPHRTEVAGFMTFLHGDARFYNNIFLQKPVREDFLAVKEREKNGPMASAFGNSDEPNFTVGTKPYDGFPTAEAYFEQFAPPKPGADLAAMFGNDKYYDHLPVYTGGNVYFNGAQPCDIEENYKIVDAHVAFELIDTDGKLTIKTDIYDKLPKFATPLVSTELLGEAFEPEQPFENPDGSPIFFNVDYFDDHRGVNPVAGPFEGTPVGKRLF